ncbi:hypothetical protein AGOR_G00211560 [Albula goreensis]|uniref:Nuclear pore complex protein Nup153 n=1 Tax=Albula goreensis TaxID=1534307 RepID=A0A8T3CRL3_9TELE|nr:hypothetical protein AGOR_G00211560 [Albula goreensis]
MASAGGGKIRSRRYHIASKPYAKSKQQGLISRVTDTVKSIVPSWLQSYFKNSGQAEAAAQDEEQPVPHQNSQPPHLPVDGEDASPLIDEQEPKASTSNSEPSTSRSALNFQDILARPPLNRTHLHLPSLDSSPALRGGASTLFSQPSTSSAPFTSGVASGYSLVKEIKDSGSLHEDDNISTTSGFSSRASDKDVTTSKNAPFIWSPENDRTHPGPQPAGSTLKKPAFNLSVFGTSSSSPSNSLILNSSKLGDSPFYPGKTTYGGSSATRSGARVRADTPYQAPVRRQIKVKGAASQPCGVTSLTARRILQSLERMSSPLADAKRIPSPCSLALPTALNRTDMGITHPQSKRKKLDNQLPPVQKLVTPSTPPVGGNRSISFRASLTPFSNLSGLQDRRNSKDRPARQSTQTTEAAVLPVESTSGLYPMSSTPAANGTDSRGSGGKMRRERSVRASTKPAPEDEVVEVPDLPPISLPISGSSLPTFNFSSPPAQSSITASTPAVSSTPLTNKVQPAATSPPCAPFTFSSPIVKATEPSVLPLSPSSGFTFSAPVAKPGLSDFNGKAAPAVTQVKPLSAADSQAKTNEEFEGPFQPAKTLKSGSVLDILRGPGFSSSSPASTSLPVKTPPTTLALSSDSASESSSKFKPAAGSWNYDTGDTVCLDTRTGPPPSGFGTLFAPPTGSWECDTCLVQNKAEASKCVACETPKPGTGVKPALTLPAFTEAPTASTPSNSNSSSATTATTNNLSSGFIGFGDKFKKPEGSWECDACMLENKAQDSKCVSCQTAKPGAAPAPSTAPETQRGLVGFGDKFKKPEGAWECDVCCVQNKADALQCVACQSNKPGAKVEPKGFGASSLSTSASTFTFGIQSSSSSSSSTDPAPASSGGFKFGDQGGFKFGNTSSGGFGGGFKFGASSSSSSTEDEKSKSQSEGSGGGFKFGIGAGIVFGSGSTESADQSQSKAPEAESSAAPAKTEESTFAPVAPAFTFSAPKDKPETTSRPPGPPPQTLQRLRLRPPPSVSGNFLKRSPWRASRRAALRSGNRRRKTQKRLPPPTLTSIAPAPTPTPAPTFSFRKVEDKAEPAAAAPASFRFSAAKEAENPAPPLGSPSASPTHPRRNQNPSSLLESLLRKRTQQRPPSRLSTSEGPPQTLRLLLNQRSGASSEPAPAKTFLFGQTQDSKPQPTAPQNAAAAPPTGAQPFLFGSSTSTPSFSFGATAPSTASSTASGSSAAPFVFGSAAASSAPPAFGAGATPAFGQGSSQPSAPAFGSGAPSLFSAPASQPPAFGVQPNATFGQQASATPSFGSAAASSSTAPGGGFQFGGASAFGASGGNAGVFAFGGAAGTPSAPSPAPAGAAQPPAPGGGFSFSQPPSFNIGSAKSSFTASNPGQHSISGRKIKMAVRRRK